MLKILNFFKSTTGETKIISMRERFENAQCEMNAVLSELSDMPNISIDVANRQIDIAAPDQFADEALALPAPEPDPEPGEKVQDETASDEADTKKEDESGSNKASAA